MATPQDLINFERQYNGYREGPNNSTLFGTWIGVPNAAWCDSFQHFGAFSLGFRFPGSQCGDKGDAAVGFTISWHQRNNLWSDRNGPRVGSFVTYDWKSRGNWNDFHIELVIDVEDSRILVIGGNVQDAVVEQWRPRNNLITGYCHLPYGGNPIPAPPPPPPPPPPQVNSSVVAKLANIYVPFPGRNLTLTSPFMRSGPTTNQDVWRWQAGMKTRGWACDADGIFGPQSHDVAVKFQREKGLVADGIVGPMTWHTTFFAPIT